MLTDWAEQLVAIGGRQMATEKVVISGASGLIGTALAQSLQAGGIQVLRLVRRTRSSLDEAEWHPGKEPLDPEVLRGATAVVNLNGASIGKLPWTRAYRKRLWVSRQAPTRTLATAVHALGPDAPLFVSASAVGFYGDRPGEVLSEQSGAGGEFLARLSNAWEQEAVKAGSDARVALIRTAPVLHPDATLKPLIALTRLGLGGPLGDGKQVWPWIALEDEIAAIRHIIDNGMTGPVNLSSPVAASMNDIGGELARQLGRPYWLPVPAWALRAVVGADVADSLLLTDADVVPQVLQDSGFTFAYPTVAEALAAALEPGAGEGSSRA